MIEFVRAAVQSDAWTLPRRYYASKEVFGMEAERIFYAGWVCVGRAEQIARPGDYFLAQLIGESIIVVRDRDGQAHAFFNVCRHRGTRMCTEESGQFAGSIQCPYHAWTYGLDGQLLAARHMQETPGFAKRDYPLRAIALAEWEGFLFLNLAPDPAPFARAFAPLIDKFPAWHMPSLRRARRIEYNVQANWKLIVQNYSECYHCPLIHPALDRLSPSTSGRNDLSDILRPDAAVGRERRAVAATVEHGAERRDFGDRTDFTIAPAKLHDRWSIDPAVYRRRSAALASLPPGPTNAGSGS